MIKILKTILLVGMFLLWLNNAKAQTESTEWVGSIKATVENELVRLHIQPSSKLAKSIHKAKWVGNWTVEVIAAGKSHKFTGSLEDDVPHCWGFHDSCAQHVEAWVKVDEFSEILLAESAEINVGNDRGLTQSTVLNKSQLAEFRKLVSLVAAERAKRIEDERRAKQRADEEDDRRRFVYDKFTGTTTTWSKEVKVDPTTTLRTALVEQEPVVVNHGNGNSESRARQYNTVLQIDFLTFDKEDGATIYIIADGKRYQFEDTSTKRLGVSETVQIASPELEKVFSQSESVEFRMGNRDPHSFTKQELAELRSVFKPN